MYSFKLFLLLFRVYFLIRKVTEVIIDLLVVCGSYSNFRKSLLIEGSDSAGVLLCAFLVTLFC